MLCDDQRFQFFKIQLVQIRKGRALGRRAITSTLPKMRSVPFVS